MRLDSIILLLLSYMKVNKAKEQDYQELKEFIKKSSFFDGKRKKMYKKINKFKN